MELASHLAGFVARPPALAAVAAVLIQVFRVKTAAARHAAWALVLIGMLWLAALAPFMPSIPLRVLPAQPQIRVSPLPEFPPGAEGALTAGTASAQGAMTSASSSWLSWQRAALAVYACGAIFFLIRLAFGYLFTRRLFRASRALGGDLYESSWILVPLTVGWRRPRILLPAGWKSWESSKLAAVLAHERAHVRRGDWAIALAAGVNRCLYWFHPLAWWLERRLAALAEQASDDSALRETGSRESYAQALLEMAAAVSQGGGRLTWEAMAMAKAAEVRMRIERILDEAREIPRDLSRARLAVLVVCVLPVIYMASAVHLVQAQEQTAAQARARSPYLATLANGEGITAEDAARLEQHVAQHPENVPARSRLIAYYYLNSKPAELLKHVYWLIENYPESGLTVLYSTAISREDGLNDRAASDKAAALWRQVVSNRFNDARVLVNAAQFFEETGGELYEVERLYERAHLIEPQNAGITQRFATMYARAIAFGTGDPAVPGTATQTPGFAESAKARLLSSSDGWLIALVGRQLSAVGRQRLFFESVDLNAHPLVRAVAEFGEKLLLRAQTLGITTAVQDTTARSASPRALAKDPAPPVLHRVDPLYPPIAREARISGVVELTVTTAPDGSVSHIQLESGHPLLATSAMEAVKQWKYAPAPAPVTFHQSVIFTLPEAAARPAMRADAASPSSTPAPPVLSRVEPVYPPLALQARISGVVRLNVTIGADGAVTRTTVLGGHPLLVPSALEAVRHWIYAPTAAETTFEERVNFRLP